MAITETDNLLLRMPEGLKRRIKYQAGCNGRSMTQEINIILEFNTKYLEVPEEFDK